MVLPISCLGLGWRVDRRLGGLDGASCRMHGNDEMVVGEMCCVDCDDECGSSNKWCAGGSDAASCRRRYFCATHSSVFSEERNITCVYHKHVKTSSQNDT